MAQHNATLHCHCLLSSNILLEHHGCILKNSLLYIFFRDFNLRHELLHSGFLLQQPLVRERLCILHQRLCVLHHHRRALHAEVPLDAGARAALLLRAAVAVGGTQQVLGVTLGQDLIGLEAQVKETQVCRGGRC